jgi:hypothetical protein
MDTTAPTNLLGKTPTQIINTANAIADKHNKLIFEVLRSYRDLMNCATVQAMDKNNPQDHEAQVNKLNFRDPETMAAAGIRTQRKFDQLVSRQPVT